MDSRLETLSATNPYMRVYYEDFLQSSEDVVTSLVRFLECDPSLLGNKDYRKLKKQSKSPAQEYISNYDELVEQLQRRALLDPV